MGKTVERIALGIVAVLVALPLLAAAGPGLIGSAVKVNGPAAESLTCSFPIDHVCPGNGNRLEEQARQRQTTPTTTPTPTPRPYGPPNGPVRPLPSVTPAAPPPEPPRVVGEGTGGILGGGNGGLLGKIIPSIGPVIQGGLKAIGPGVAP